jgi:bile acid:Na+ symporter, BASS family
MKANLQFSNILKLSKNSSLVLILSLILGLAIPEPAHHFQTLIMPTLIIMMIFSLIELDLTAKRDLKGGIVGFALNYLLLSGIILALASRLESEEMRYGFIVMAAVPPAIAVLPLTRLLSGDVRLSLYGEAVSYFAAIFIMPILILLLAHEKGLSVTYTIGLAILLILFPVLASRFLRNLNLDPILIINVGFFIITYTVIGLNSGIILKDMEDVALIALTRTIIIGIVVFQLLKFAGMNYERRISYTLFSSYKNLGMAAAISIDLFGPKAGIPAAACIVAETVFYIFLSLTRSHGSLK